MASAGTGGGSMPSNFFLTPQQQNLLFTALNANQEQSANSSVKNGLSLSSESFKTSPMTNVDGTRYQESPYLDTYDYDFGDSSFDFSFASDATPVQGNGEDSGDMHGSSNSDSAANEQSEKRSHPDDEDDETSPGNESKRRESTDKMPKKPGRKPLTSEPTSKRKAQNRAAQRAFRDRKERHLKDLETKVEELERESAAANHENSRLRGQVERITSELNHYKQRLTLSPINKALPREKVPFGNAAVNNLGDVSFQFEFPKFGALPGPTVNKPQRSASQPISPQQSTHIPSPAMSQINDKNQASNFSQQAARNAQFKEDLAKFSGIFSPSMTSSNRTGSRASVDSANYGLGAAISSPSTSSHSNVGASSSCGTSPEPFTQSPMGFKPVDTLTTIGEEQSGLSTTNEAYDNIGGLNFANNGFDWLSQQNGGQFDPQLFGGYREPQENILSSPSFDDLFNDSIEADFYTPYNAAPIATLPKKNLIAEIDARQDSVEDEIPPENISCNDLWDKLQACPNAQAGDFDLDGLCSELTKKAKCSGKGPMVAEVDFDTILKKYMGKDLSTSCVADKLGFKLDKQVKPDLASLP